MEQFYCFADSCVQNLANGGDSADWSCQNLQCTCRPGTTFCGGTPGSNLTNTINGLIGTLGIDCGVVNATTNTAACNFKQTTLQGLFGLKGLALNGCSFGECVRQDVIDSNGNVTDTPTEEHAAKSLSGGVIAGLAVVGALVLIAILLLLWGCFKQKAARRTRSDDDSGINISVEWDSMSYSVPSSGGAGWIGGLRRRKGASNDDKVVLDSVSGRVQAGQMMAILGPSGKSSNHCPFQ